MQHYSGVIILDGPMGSHLEGLQYELWSLCTHEMAMNGSRENIWAKILQRSGK